MGQPDLSGYVEVNERIAAFYEVYPTGSLQGSWTVETIGEAVFIVYQAQAYRTPDDRRPGQGTAWEPFPGRTPYTRDSELMVGETSAWGRAIASLGFEVKRSVASREEVANRQNGTKLDPERVEAITAKLRERKLKIGEISVLLGAAGIDGLRAHSKLAIQERLASLDEVQAAALEGLLHEA